MVETIACWYFQGNRIVPGILRCKGTHENTNSTRSWEVPIALETVFFLATGAHILKPLNATPFADPSNKPR